MVWKGKVGAILVSILITLTQTAVASGIITIQLVEYDHHDGKDADGKCCESIWSFGCKANDCDPYFDLCLKNRTNGKDVSTKITDRTTDVGHIHFGNNIGTTPNNIVLDFTGPLSDLDLNIKVVDSDSDGAIDKKDDLIEILTQRVQLSPTMFSPQPSTFSDLHLNGARTSISLRYRAVCDQYYYGQECDVMCKPQPNYYICDDHGNKLCNANWTGPNCDIQTDDCWCNPCLNGGTCIDGNMTYTCTCPSDYSGQDCELPLSTSTTTTALHIIANLTTTATGLHHTANSTSTSETHALHNDNLTTATTVAIRLASLTPLKTTTILKHSLTNASDFQISTMLPNVTVTLTPFRQTGMHINFNTTNMLQSGYEKWSTTIRMNQVTISETKPSAMSIHKNSDATTLLPLVGGAIAGTGVLLAVCGLLIYIIKRRQKIMAELGKNNKDTRKLAWI